MYNLNVNVTTSAPSAVNNLLAVESACTTPRTPEILNSLIAMSNPLDGFNFSSGTADPNVPGGKARPCPPSAQNDSCSNSSGSQVDSPTSPPSVQHTCSQLIKAGLKLSIQSKRKQSGDNTGDLLDLDASASKKQKLCGIKGEITGSDDDDYDSMFSPGQGLTPEDEERRRKRRERNKIAATKCRLKKREKTVNLVQESETLETQNIELKTQIQELETQRRRLVDMLSMHTPACVKQTGGAGTPTGNQHHQYADSYSHLSALDIKYDPGYGPHPDELSGGMPPVSNLSNSAVETTTLAYSRPASVDIPLTYSNQRLEQYNRVTGVGVHPNDQENSYTKPSIIVSGPNDSFSTQLTNLDSPTSPYQYNATHCHNYDSPSSQSGQSYTSSGIDNGCMA